MKSHWKGRPGLVVKVSKKRERRKTTVIRVVAENTLTGEKKPLKSRVRNNRRDG